MILPGLLITGVSGLTGVWRVEATGWYPWTRWLKPIDVPAFDAMYQLIGAGEHAERLVDPARWLVLGSCAEIRPAMV